MNSGSASEKLPAGRADCKTGRFPFEGLRPILRANAPISPRESNRPQAAPDAIMGFRTAEQGS